jgi:RHS repeat-associated protein
MGRRIYKSALGGTSVFVYDSDTLVEETNSLGGVVAGYAQGHDIIEVDEPLAIRRNSTVGYYQADALGSVTSVSDGFGALAQTYRFDSFGKPTPSGSLVNSFQFTGRELDSEINLYFYRARYYDAFSGRFASEDPARFPGGINFYAYVENDPVALVDPFGFCPWHVHSRPLKGVPGAKTAGLDHYYFYNVETGQSIGLGPSKTTVFGPVPGVWERNEKPGFDNGPIKDYSCDCVDKKAKNPGKPPNYCTLHGNGENDPNPTCPNCIGWVIGVLQDCRNKAFGDKH